MVFPAFVFWLLHVSSRNLERLLKYCEWFVLAQIPLNIEANRYAFSMLERYSTLSTVKAGIVELGPSPFILLAIRHTEVNLVVSVRESQ